MGNHDVGRAMGAGAKAVMQALGPDKPSPSKALGLLDTLAEPFRGADAEWDDELFGPTPLALLIAAAFDATDDELASLLGLNKDDNNLWFNGPYLRFCKRYEFC